MVGYSVRAGPATIWNIRIVAPAGRIELVSNAYQFPPPVVSALRRGYGLLMLDAGRHDLKYAWRFLFRNRAFAWAAIVALALRIGANTVVFSAAYSIILNPLPYADASRLVAVRYRSASWSPSMLSASISMPAADDISESTRSLVDIARLVPTSFVMTGGVAPDSVDGLQVSGGWFGLYGVAPILGRVVGTSDTSAKGTIRAEAASP